VNAVVAAPSDPGGVNACASPSKIAKYSPNLPFRLFCVKSHGPFANRVTPSNGNQPLYSSNWVFGLPEEMLPLLDAVFFFACRSKALPWDVSAWVSKCCRTSNRSPISMGVFPPKLIVNTHVRFTGKPPFQLDLQPTLDACV
jgi:hypothetical protein